MKTWILFALVLVLLISGLVAAQADESEPGFSFQWTVDCQERDAAGRLHVWVGYNSSKSLPDSYLAYIGNGPGIYLDGFEAGEHRRVIEVLLPNEADTLQLFIYPENVGITISEDLTAPDCSAGTGRPDGGIATITKDVSEGCYRWWKQDPYGTWGDTGATTCSQVEGDHVFVRLALGPDNSDTDANHYRVYPAG